MPERIYTHEVVDIVGAPRCKRGDKVSVVQAKHKGAGWWQGRFGIRGRKIYIPVQYDFGHHPPYPKIKLRKLH